MVHRVRNVNQKQKDIDDLLKHYGNTALDLSNKINSLKNWSETFSNSSLDNLKNKIVKIEK
jgi:hypothetical protein